MRRLQYLFVSAVFACILLAAASCDPIFEYGQDCSTKIKFEFRKHRQALQTAYGEAADVFASTVGSVHLFVYDADSGELAFEQFATADRLRSEADFGLGAGRDKCYLAVDLAPGTYRIVAWCGLDENDGNNAFALGAAARAAVPYDRCSVRLAGPGRPVNDAKYEALYHGVVAEATVTSTGEVIPVALTKNTNDIAVWVQHTSATFGPGDYEVVYTDANGTMRFDDNTMAANDVLEYRPHTTSLLTASTEYNGSLVEAGALVAHLSTARLMAAHKGDARLEVRNREGATVFSIPFLRYLLEMQTFTPDGQYYLDCEDTYNCSFYLSGEGEHWAPALIIINNWVKVPDQNGSIGGE